MHVVPYEYIIQRLSCPIQAKSNKNMDYKDLDKYLRGYFEKISIQATSSPRHQRKIVRAKIADSYSL